MAKYRTCRNKKTPIFKFLFMVSMICALGFGAIRGVSEAQTEKDILSDEVFAVYEQVKSKLFIQEQIGTAPKIAKTSDYTVTLPIVIAAWMGWVDPHVYIWNNDNEYEIRSVWENTSFETMPPWTGFWVQVNRDVNILIWPFDLELPWPPWIVPAAPSSMNYTLQPDTYHFISVPLVPSNIDINATFGSILGDGEAGQTWLFSKWNAPYGDYIRYNEPDDSNNDFLKLIPGRGFWAYHIHPDARVLTLEGSPVTAFKTVAFKTPSNEGSPAAHMLGNPYHYGICWWNVAVQIEMDDALPLGKIAGGGTFNTMESWYIGLEVKDNTGVYQDTYNRAGVIETGDDLHDLLNANDLPPLGDNVRILLRNPDASEENPLAFDYRSPGIDEYVWEVELSTTLAEVDVQFALNKIMLIPSHYQITLEDIKTGNVVDVTNDTILNLSLSSLDEPTTFLLKATRITPASVKNAAPFAIRINGVSPNPFNPGTTISFDVEHSGNVSVNIFNSNGQLVETLTDSYMTAGSHKLTWNAASYSSGIYVVSVKSGGVIDSRKITFMK